MAYTPHPSAKPTPPRKPPATSTTDGQANTVARTETGDGTMRYGSGNGTNMRLHIVNGSERAGDFK